MFTAKKGDGFSCAYSDLTGIVYERAATPRYKTGLLLAWPLLFTKGKKHFVTLQHEDGYAIIRLHKSNYREALAELEARSGVKVERYEER